MSVRNGHPGFPVLAAGLVLGASLIGACQSTSQIVPAVLASDDPTAMDRLKAALGRSLGRSNIDLGPSAPTRNSTISVLPSPPGPLDDRSLAKPIIFYLRKEGETCILVREDTGARVLLEGVECRPATS